MSKIYLGAGSFRTCKQCGQQACDCVKPKPLKGKFIYANILQGYCDETYGYKVLSNIDVKSAVDWLKEEITKRYKFKGNSIYCLIDEAFEDVMKE